MKLLDFTKKSWFLQMLAKSQENYWLPEQVDLSTDKLQWLKIPKETKKIVLDLLGYAIFLDSFQVGNIAELCSLADDPDLQALLSFHSMMETIHSKSYAYFAETCLSPKEKKRLYDTEEIEKRFSFLLEVKNTWGPEVANYFLEAVSFQPLFRLADVLKEQALLPGFSSLLLLIKRDELLHMATFAYIIRQEPYLVEKCKAAFDYASKQEAEIIARIVPGDPRYSQEIKWATAEALKAIGIKLEQKPSDPFGKLRKINDETKRNLRENFFTTTVTYSQLDSEKDWNVNNWF